MTYTNIVIVFTNILFAVMALLFLHFFFFAFIGIFFKTSCPKTEEKLKYGLIIPARNEEAVVSGLILSMQKNNYPQDKLHIFVVAHNCTDNTAKIARELGATVYEYNNPEENTMGFAFKYLFSCIERDYGTQNYDGFLIFNADNVLDKDYFSRMNDAFIYYDRKAVVTSFRNTKNWGSNLISGLYGMYFATGCRLESRGRTFMGCSTRVQGTGYLINSEIVKDGWPYVTLAEDWEFTADRVLLANSIRICDDAVFYDEQPTSFGIMWRQRLRWSKGHLIVYYTRIKELMHGIFSKNTVNRGSVYDIMVNVLPSTIFVFGIQILQFVLMMLAPVFDHGMTYKAVFLGTTTGFWTTLLFSKGLLFRWLRAVICFYIITLIGAIVVFIIERKRIKGISLHRKIWISILWPLFLLIQFFIDIQAFCSTEVKWEPIPHSDQTSFEHVNEPADEEAKDSDVSSAGQTN